MKSKPVIAITMGDVAGIGPEVALKAACDLNVKKNCFPVIIGSFKYLQKLSQVLDLTEQVYKINEFCLDDKLEKDIPVIDVVDVPFDEVTFGSISDRWGKAAMVSVKSAVDLALNGKVDGISTAPICKEAIHKAGYTCSGHTEYLAELTKSNDVSMMFAGHGLNLILTTIHVALSNVPELIKKEKVYKTILLGIEALKQSGFKSPRVAVCGLNPHAGEDGLFGSEEAREILPAIQLAQKEGHKVYGPVPADTVFHRTLQGEFDLIVAMYHDQALSAFKTIAFNEGVNITVGIPIIRTSPDHGTAFAIAGSGKANPESMIQSVILAANMAINRQI